MSLDEMTPREIVRGLMRGDRSQHKQGYSAIAAVGSADTLRDLGAVELADLEAYAEGFADGMAEDQTRTQPARHGEARSEEVV